jgi:hypothetical protein
MDEVVQTPIAITITKGNRRPLVFVGKNDGNPAALDGDPTTEGNTDDAVSVLVKDEADGLMYFRGIAAGTTSGTLDFDTRIGPDVNNIQVPYSVTVTDAIADEATSVDVSVGEEQPDPLAV